MRACEERSQIRTEIDLESFDNWSDILSILCSDILEVMLVNEVAGFVQPREDPISSLMVVSWKICSRMLNISYQ